MMLKRLVVILMRYLIAAFLGLLYPSIGVGVFFIFSPGIVFRWLRFKI